MKHTQKQIDDYKFYLITEYCEGRIDEEVFEDLANREAWGEIHKMMDHGDLLANNQEEV